MRNAYYVLGRVSDSGERLSILELNNQSNYTPPFHATMHYVSHVQHQDCVQTLEYFWAQTLYWQLDNGISIQLKSAYPSKHNTVNDIYL